MMKLPQRLFVILAVGVLSACATARPPADPQAETSVRVDNRAMLDVNIYVLRGAERIRLGTVNGLSTKVLRIPNSVLFGPTTLRFLADPIGSDRMPVTMEIIVSAGDRVGLQIPPF